MNNINENVDVETNLLNEQESNTVEIEQGQEVKPENVPLHSYNKDIAFKKSNTVVSNTLAYGDRTPLNYKKDESSISEDLSKVRSGFSQYFKSNVATSSLKIRDVVEGADESNMEKYITPEAYIKSPEYNNLLNSPDPEDRKLAEFNLKTITNTDNYYKNEILPARIESRRKEGMEIALSREAAQATLEGIDNKTIRTTAQLAVPILASVGDFVEVIKGVAVGTAVSSAVAAIGLPFAVASGVAALADVSAGMLDSYLTMRWENEMGISNYTDDERRDIALTAGVVQGGTMLAGRLIGSAIKKYRSHKFKPYAEKINALAIENSTPNNTPNTTEKLNIVKLIQETSDDYSGLPRGTTEILNYKDIELAPNEKGIVTYSPKKDVTRKEKTNILKEMYNPEGEVIGYQSGGKYKGQNVIIETGKNITFEEGDVVLAKGFLRSMAEAERATIYSIDEAGNKTPLVGTAKTNAYFSIVVGVDNTEKLTETSVTLAKRFQRITNINKEIERYDKYGNDLGVEATEKVDIKVGYAQKETMRNIINDNIVAPINREYLKTSVENYENLAKLLVDYDGDIVRFTEEFESGGLAKIFVRGYSDVENSPANEYMNPIIKSSDYMFADSKSKALQRDSKVIMNTYGQLFEVSETGELVPTQTFKDISGGDINDSIIDIMINKDNAIETGGVLNSKGINSPEAAMDIIGSMVTYKTFNGMIIDKALSTSNDIGINNVMEKAGLKTLDDSGKTSVSHEDFFNGIKFLSENIANGVDVEDSKKAMLLLFNSEESPFKTKDAYGNVTGSVSASDIISNQITDSGTSFRNVEKSLKPISKAVVNYLKVINTGISKFEQTEPLRQGIKDVKLATEITNSVIADLIPNYKPSSTKGKSLENLIDGIVLSDPAKIEAVFKSAKFKKDILKLKELNDKYGFLEDDSLIYDLD
ncbi:MAG: hypothetical protein ACRC45_01870, partial [Cetobacterium sp.]